MSVQETNEVDAIGVDNITGYVTLAIFDSLEWEFEEEHLLMIQQKLNTYLRFIESGEVYETFEQARGRKFEIKIHFKNPIPLNCKMFIREAKKVIIKAGYLFNYKIG